MRAGDLVSYVEGNSECVLLWVKDIEREPLRVQFIKAQTIEATGNLEVIVKNYYSNFSEEVNTMSRYTANPESLFICEEDANRYRAEEIRAKIERLNKNWRSFQNECRKSSSGWSVSGYLRRQSVGSILSGLSAGGFLLRRKE